MTEVEGQPVSEITGEAIRARVEEFFSAMDFFPGSYMHGVIEHWVDKDNETGEVTATASVNGFRLAMMYKNPGVEEIYTLNGKCDFYGTEREVGVSFDTSKQGPHITVTQQRLANYGATGLVLEEVEIQDPQEQIQVARTLGVKV